MLVHLLKPDADDAIDLCFLCSDGMWGGPGSGGPQGGQPPQLSVVTTVWGVTQTTQTGPYNQNPTAPSYTNTTMSATQNSFTSAQPGFPGPNPGMGGGPKGFNHQGGGAGGMVGPYRQPTPGAYNK